MLFTIKDKINCCFKISTKYHVEWSEIYGITDRGR